MQNIDFEWFSPEHEFWIEQASEFKAPRAHGETIPLAAYIQMGTVGPPRSFLTNGSALWQQRARRYRPLALPISLFRTFADTELTEQAIRQFANNYGLLGRTVAILMPNVRTTSIAEGESLDAWKAEISLMKAAVHLWDLIRTRDLKALRARVRWHPNDVVDYYAQFDIGDIVASIPELDPETTYMDLRVLDMLDVFQAGDVVGPALFFLSRILTNKLENGVSLATSVDLAHSTLRMSFSPSTLLTAMWLQFALSVEQDEDFRKCRECGKWFALAPGTGRADKEFCSSACRSKAYRKRQAEARALHQRGLPINAIAKQLGVEKQIVRKWISDHE